MFQWPQGSACQGGERTPERLFLGKAEADWGSDFPLAEADASFMGEAPIDRLGRAATGTGDVNGQRRSPFINQDVYLGPTLASVCWITSCGLPTQWRGNRLAVDSLPLPADSTLAGIEADQAPHDLLPDTLLLPGLESLVQHAARNTKPVSVDGFPLATSPQHVPDAVDDRPVVGTWPSRSWFLGWLGQVSLDSAPEWAWNLEVIDILWLCATLYFADGAPREMLVLHKNNSLRGASFFHVNLFFG